MTRVYLTHADDDENHAVWMNKVQEQTGKPFTIEGAALCAAEEITEMMIAETDAEAMDSIGDIYVATGTLAVTIINSIDGDDCGGPYVGRVHATHDATQLIKHYVTYVNQLINIARKGAPAVQKIGVEAILQMCVDIRLACVMDSEESFKGGWRGVIDPVLDILDKRLQDGYTMKDGSAIKKEDT